MPRQIDYYFTLLSPWTYLGHGTFVDLARQHGLSVRYRPTPLRSVFEETGGLPLPKRHPVRQRYRVQELQRWRAKRGLPLTLFPKFFPYDVSLGDRIVLAVIARGEDPAGFIGEVLADVWAREQNMSQPELILAAAERVGLDPAGLIEAAGSETTSQAYQAAIAEAVEAGIFGAPSYVLDGEIFWGQDRLDLLADALASGRAAYRNDATA
ncbi:disulfide bond formation protein DsbA [Bosea sp. Root483D1]|uniref:2-hydroxychromene-2-carboxylate isomerase n=1 Tax=Bosea sp. Root483D1 TaxID=1736544 RepID=UPI00070A03FA|nr:2-hydroxychromene-2-carboxylate isomerase [Bosea sp. Root483D1]KRE16163.1 disulfide bond formation protein DsbA [Bosea sp. Root483D1]